MIDKYHVFAHVYGIPPIDEWEGALPTTEEEREAVLNQMPEDPIFRGVSKLIIFVPGICELVPVYLCKAENNGTVYIFSDCELSESFKYDLWEIKKGE